MARSSPGIDQKNPTSSYAVTRSTRPRHFRFFVANSIAKSAPLVVGILWGWDHHRQSQHLNSTASELRSVQQMATDLGQRRREVEARFEIQQSELLDRSSALEQSRVEIVDLTDQRDAFAAESRFARDATRRITEFWLARASLLASQLTTDPTLCREVCRDVDRFAAEQGLDTPSEVRALNQLPVGRRLPDDTQVSILGVERSSDSLQVDFTVSDHKKTFVSGLHRVDVEVHSGQRRLHAVSVQTVLRQQGRQEIALLLDGSTSTGGQTNDALKAAAIQFVERLAGPARLRVWRFADTVEPLTPWTLDAEVQSAAIQTLNSKGGTALYKAIRVAVGELQRRTGKHAIVLFTDGNDSLGQDSIEDILAHCRQAAIPIHVVALESPDTNRSLLEGFASATGGSFHVLSRAERLVDEFQSIARSFQEPGYRLRIDEPLDAKQVTIKIGGLSAIPIPQEKRHP